LYATISTIIRADFHALAKGKIDKSGEQQTDDNRDYRLAHSG